MGLYGNLAENFSRDWVGRIISINLVLKSASLSLCNFYAPNDSQQQEMFLHNLNEYLMSKTDIKNLIIGGDWNVTLQPLDKRGGFPWKESTYRNKRISMMEELEIIYIFRNNTRKY